MKGWQRSLLWEGLPLLMLLGVFGSIAAINWDYESKLLTPDRNVTDGSSVYLGPIMLAIALAQALIGSGILLLVRVLKPKVTSGPWLLVPMMLVTVFLTLPSLFIVILGPAAITMVEQMRAAPR